VNTTADHPRGRNPRGQGERLREEVLAAALRMLDESADHQALSLRAVAREVGIAATSIYIHFADRDALVLAALERAHGDLMESVQHAADGAPDPVAKLRARVHVLGNWARQHPGLYKVLNDRALSQRVDTSFKLELRQQTSAAIQLCMDEGLAPAGDVAEISFDLRAAVHGAVSTRVDEPDRPWPPLEEQIDRYLIKLVGISPSALQQASA
jgi:AcrR family transcriptional regulator